MLISWALRIHSAHSTPSRSF
jgi:hypothetical protein